MAGTVKADVIQSELTTPTVFKNSSGTEIGQLIKSWVNFVGTSAAINASFNTSSMTRSAAGSYYEGFTIAMTDNKFAVTGATSAEGSYGNSTLYSSTSNSTTVAYFYVADYNSATKCDQTSVYAKINR